MLTSLVTLCVRNAGAVVAVALALMLGAFVALERLPVDVFPDLEGTRVTVLSEAPGLTTEEVERLVTIPIERALLGARGVERVRSSSVSGLSIVYVDYQDGEQLDRARQRVSERLATVNADLPDGVVPGLGPDASLTGEFMQIAASVSKGGVDPLELRAWAEFELRPLLLSISGVAQVSVMGGRLPELTVAARQDAMRGFNLTLVELADAVRAAHSTVSAGYLPDDAGRELEVRQRARVEVADDLRSAIVRDDGPRPVRLSEVADILVEGAPRRGSASIVRSSEDPSIAIVLALTKAPGTNTLAVTDRVDSLLANLSLPEGVVLDYGIARHASFINRAVAKVRTVGFEAAIIVSVVLVLFLLNLRTALIALCAIPLSLGITVIWLRWSGGGLDVMTLGGMAIAIGVLVDDAIIDVENVLRRLRKNAALPELERRPAGEVVIAATAEIRPAMVQATLILAIAFLPLLFLQGLEGKFFRPLGLTFVVALLASLGVALTVTPALCRLLLSRSGPAKTADGHGPLARVLLRFYRPMLDAALRFRVLVLVGAAGLVAVTVLGARELGTSFLPRFHEGMATVFVYAPPGTSLEESESLADDVSARVASVDGVSLVVRRTGRAERDEHVEPVWNSELEVSYDDPLDAEAVLVRIRAALDSLSGLTTSMGQPIEHRLSHVLSGTAADLAVEVYHEDPIHLAATTSAIALVLGDVPGTREVNAQRTLTVEGLTVDWDRAAIARVGTTVADFAGQLRAAIHGEVVGRIVDGLARTDLVVRLVRDERRSADHVRNIELVTPRGARMRASDMATIEIEDAPAMLLRQGGRRKGVVTCNLEADANLGDVVGAARERLGPIAEAQGAEIRFGGQYEAAARGQRTLMLSGLLVAAIGVVLLRTTVKSWIAALVIALNLPLATVGGVVALYIATDHPVANVMALMRGDPSFAAPIVSLSTLVGFATLFGIALRGGVLLAGRWETLVEQGVPVQQAIREGVEDRLVPILMTALTAALGLVPVALASGEPGTELLAPLAIVVLGGLTSSTILNLIVLPAAYALVRRGR